MPKEKNKPQKKTKERGNGKGTVYKLPSGRWRWQFTLGYDLNGKRETVDGTAENKTLADLALSQAITDHARGLLSSSDSVTLKTYANKWLSRQKGLRPSTINGYEADIAYAMKHLGKMKLKDVRPHHIKDCLTKLSEQIMQAGMGKGKPMSNRTLSMVRKRLKAIFAEAVIDQIIYVNPCTAVKGIKQPTLESVGVVMDFVQMTRFHELGLALYTAKVLRLFPALFTAASLGLRRGEVMALRWQDIDFKKNVLSVRKNLTVVGGKPIHSEPKTRYSKRDIPMPITLKNVLLEHRNKQEGEREKAMNAWHDRDTVFATETGNYTHPEKFAHALNSLLAWSKPENFNEKRCRALPVKARTTLEAIILSGDELPDMSPHDLRHTAATLMLRRKVPVEVVSRILGHARVSITLDVYRQVLDSEKEQVMVDLFDTPLPTRQVNAPLPN